MWTSPSAPGPVAALKARIAAEKDGASGNQKAGAKKPGGGKERLQLGLGEIAQQAKEERVESTAGGGTGLFNLGDVAGAVRGRMLEGPWPCGLAGIVARRIAHTRLLMAQMGGRAFPRSQFEKNHYSLEKTAGFFRC